MLDDVLPLLQGGGRGNLCEEWQDIAKMCRAIVANPALLTGYVALSKSLHLRAPTPVLSMVAVDLMRKIEEFIGKMDARKISPNYADKMTQKAWFKVLEIIVHFRLPVYVGPKNERYLLPSNGRCWTVP
jgi:hypothetical protein